MVEVRDPWFGDGLCFDGGGLLCWRWDGCMLACLCCDTVARVSVGECPFFLPRSTCRLLMAGEAENGILLSTFVDTLALGQFPGRSRGQQVQRQASDTIPVFDHQGQRSGVSDVSDANPHVFL
jgi:hypothetical protein